MKTALAISAVLCVTLFVLSGCAPKPQPPAPPAPAKTAPSAPAAPSAAASLGESIFTTGIGADGKHVAFDKGSTMFKSKPGGCAPCHGADGMGKKTPQGKEFPPIHYSALRAPRDGKPATYKDDAALANPITKGLDEKGEALSDDMPRWKFTDAELAAVVQYLKDLDTKAPAAAETKALPTKAPATPSATKK